MIIWKSTVDITGPLEMMQVKIHRGWRPGWKRKKSLEKTSAYNSIRIYDLNWKTPRVKKYIKKNLRYVKYDINKKLKVGILNCDMLDVYVIFLGFIYIFNLPERRFYKFDDVKWKAWNKNFQRKLSRIWLRTAFPMKLGIKFGTTSVMNVPWNIKSG